MSQYWILVVILLPIVGGVALPLLPMVGKRMAFLVEGVCVLTTVLVWALLLGGEIEPFEVVQFVKGLSISFRIDGLSMLFAGLVSLLWPFATLYSFEYMEHDKRPKEFFMFYSMTYGITLGLAFSANLVTMYFFYELLTLCTVPLVIHTLTREAVLAARKYLYFSLGGAAFALMGLVFVSVYSPSTQFVLGGVLDMALVGDKSWLLLGIYFFAFMGFGVKAAIWPLSGWLPQAGVAPTPVTALLHAVAVVKAGVFAMMRLTYYSFGTEFLKGTWVQYAVMAIAIFTIFYGSTKALKETHIKRRLAYSTVSNLSYIIFGITIMTPLGLAGALLHMVCHAVMKIGSFLCAGAFMHQTGRSHVYEMDGMGRKMPVVFGCFAVAGFGLMGVPGLAGFISKWKIVEAAVDSQNVLSYIGIAILLISALLTAMYMLQIVERSFFPIRKFDQAAIKDFKDPTWKMKLPLIVFAVGTILLGLCSTELVNFIEAIAGVQ